MCVQETMKVAIEKTYEHSKCLQETNKPGKGDTPRDKARVWPHHTYMRVLQD